MASFGNKQRKQDPRSLAQLVKSEIGAVAEEAISQVTAVAERKDKVTQSPPLPVGQEQDTNLTNGQEAAGGEEEKLGKVRARLSALGKESVLAREELSQKREEIAQERNPVVEGVGPDEENNGSLPPSQVTSRPRRGFPSWTVSQPEKRQRR
jgi:hypothetical protein